MASMDVHYSSKTEMWGTPQNFFDILDAEFKFTLDPCAVKENAKCKYYFTQEQDGLKADWGKHRVFMNPPYGDVIGSWMEKAYKSALKGALVVCLIPARTDTRWWMKYCMQATEIRLVQGRLKFILGGNDESAAPAPFPSAVVVFDPAQMVEGKCQYPSFIPIDRNGVPIIPQTFLLKSKISDEVEMVEPCRNEKVCKQRELLDI